MILVYKQRISVLVLNPHKLLIPQISIIITLKTLWSIDIKSQVEMTNENSRKRPS
jgi:hypothetical protein